MAGMKDSSRPNAIYVPDWFVYRSAVDTDDDPLHPEQVAELIDMSSNLSALGGQIWIVPQKLEGDGNCTLTLVRNGFGSLATLKPFTTVVSTAAVTSLSEVRYTGLLAVPHRLLVTDITAGAKWTLHSTYFSTSTT